MYRTISTIDPIDYLIIGHVTKDLIPGGYTLGGTISYSGLTARALGWRVGVVTACSSDLDLSQLTGLSIVRQDSDFTTTFENIQTPSGRIQYLHHVADSLSLMDIPEIWRRAKVVHLAPVAQEVDPMLVRAFPEATIGLTPQGWMRGWDGDHKVYFTDWPESTYVLEQASAAVISIEDVHGNESLIEEMLASIRVLAVTEGAAGCRLYWNGDLRRFRPPTMVEIDSTGAGDIFATAFFTRLSTTHDPWEAARFATNVAAYSVTRKGLAGIPYQDEIHMCMMEVLPKS